MSSISFHFNSLLEQESELEICIPLDVAIFYPLRPISEECYCPVTLQLVLPGSCQPSVEISFVWFCLL